MIEMLAVIIGSLVIVFVLAICGMGRGVGHNPPPKTPPPRPVSGVSEKRGG